MTDGLTRRHVIISGRVQGVFFRQTTRQRAQELGLVGWVRNRRDGRVEAVFQGQSADVETILRWCEVGPERAQVDGVESRNQPLEAGLLEFRVRATE